MTVALEERMRAAAVTQRKEVLDSEDHSSQRDLSAVLRTADIYWLGIPEDRRAEVKREAEEFERALGEVGVRVVPQIHKSLEQAWKGGLNQELTLKLDEAQLDAAADGLRETVLELTTWSSGQPPGRVFAAEADQEEKVVPLADAARGLCLMCVPRERLAEPRTFDLLHLLAPRLSMGRLHRLERCLHHVEAGEPFDGALHPGLTDDRIGMIPLWPDPGRRRQRWAVAAERSWVFASPAEEMTSEDADGVVRQMVPRWERASLPRHGAVLCSVLVEVAIESAVRRAQALGRAAEGVFPLEDETAIRAALDGLAQDLAELNAGLDELEVAAADSRTDLERKLESRRGGESEEASLYASLCASLEEALAKLERSRHRLQGSFLAAREHASSRHVAATIDALRLHQESLTENQRATDELNRVVGRLTIMLLGPTIVFGALSVTDHWLPPGTYALSLVLLLAYVLAGLAVSLLIRSRLHLFTRLFTPRREAHPRDSRS